MAENNDGKSVLRTWGMWAEGITKGTLIVGLPLMLLASSIGGILWAARRGLIFGGKGGVD